jgi:hypothetical protein
MKFNILFITYIHSNGGGAEKIWKSPMLIKIKNYHSAIGMNNNLKMQK